jgi:trimeric autotransporter adhesin
MNHTYRLVWNEAAQSYVPAAEGTRARKKSGGCKALERLCTVVAAASLGGAHIGTVYAGPTGGEVVAGEASINQTGTDTTVSQQSQNVSINWQQFNVAGNETVQFVQPSATSVALNRVIGSQASQIFGRLSANGQMFLINPNGVLFGPSAQVDVGGLVASTLNISDGDFLAGRYDFASDASVPASIVNQGTITASAGGSVALLGGQVSNQGTISAHLGTVALAAGSAVSLDFSGRQLLDVQVAAAALSALAQNQQLIQADGGTVIMTAAARDALLSTVVNNTGVIEARTVQEQGGVIRLLGSFDGGTVNVGGTLDASAPGAGDGGEVETAGAYVKVADAAHITTSAPQGDAGTWLIDQADYTIAASGGDISGATLGANLENGNIIVESIWGTVNAGGTGDFHVNDDVTWSAGNTLTLRALGSVNINAVITNSGLPADGGVTLRADSAGACVAGASACGTVNFSAPGHITANVDLYYNPAGSNAIADANGIGPSYATPTDYSRNITGALNAYMLVNDVNQLQAITTNLGGRYALGAQIDASVTSGWNGGAGFVPIGMQSGAFTGVFDGLGASIDGLFINRPDAVEVGVFSRSDTGSTIRNVSLTGGAITGLDDVGALVGRSLGTVSDVYASVEVTGNARVGGLMGHNEGVIRDAGSEGAIAGGSTVGGLVGSNDGSVSDAYATGTVVGSNEVGGLVGFNQGSIEGAQATGAVTGVDSVGGLVGFNQGSVDSAHATGAVSGEYSVGGLVGDNEGAINDVYATGAVSGEEWVGGLVGENAGDLSNAYAAGSVSGSHYVGGLVGAHYGGIVTNARYNVDQVTINGAHRVTLGGLYGGQFQDWMDNGRTLDIADYAASLPFDAGTGSYLIGSVQGLRDLLGFSHIGGYSFRLTSDLDLAAAPGWYIPDFRAAQFDGAGHTIANLSIDLPFISNVGMFGRVGSASIIGNLNLAGATIVGDENVGALVGQNEGVISNISVAASVNGTAIVGGLIGENSGTVTGANVSGSVAGVYSIGGLIGTNYCFCYIRDSYATASVTGQSTVGGLIGVNAGFIEDVYATGAVSGRSTAGGLVGDNYGGVRRAYATGSVTGDVSIGGLVGINSGGAVLENVYATGSVSGTERVGGLVGLNFNRVSDAYATGSVTGQSSTGGLVGDNVSFGQVTRAYSTGAVSGADALTTGGLVGRNDTPNGLVTDSFWDIQTSGQSQSAGGSGMTSVEMRDADTFSAWNISAVGGSGAIWRIYEGYTGPLLRNFMSGITVAVDDVNTTYDGTNQGIGFNYDAGSADTSLILTGNVNFRNVGSYNLGSSLYSSQQGYDISYTGGALDIARANLIVSSSNVVKTYDGTTNASGTAVATGGTTLFGTDTLSGGTFAFMDRNAGVGNRVLTTRDATINDGNGGGNYNLTYVDNTTSTIDRASLAVTTSDVIKSYDGTTAANGTFIIAAGALIGSDSLSGGTFAFADRNAGVGKTVTTTDVVVDDGNGGGNYNLTYVDNTTSTIDRAALTVTSRDVNKTYDGTTAANGTAVVANGTLYGSDSLSGGTFAFTDRNAGTGKTVTISGMSVNDGNGGGNYRVTYVDNTSSSIDRASLIVSASDVVKTYDGTTTASGTAVATGGTTLFGSDSLSGGAFAFIDKNAGTGKAVTASGVTINDGNGGGNYSFTYIDNTSGAIERADLILSASSDRRTYDGTTASSGNVIATGNVAGDAVSAAQAYVSRNVMGDGGSTLQVTGYTITDGGGADMRGNYNVVAATAAGTIDAATITVEGAVAAADKTYDATVDTTISGGVLAGVIGADSVTLLQSGSFDDKNTGIDKAVTASFRLEGADAGNYALANSTAQTSASIFRASISNVTGITAADKAYDGSTAAALDTSGANFVGLFAGDQLSIEGANGVFSDRNAAVGKTVSIGNIALSGADARNYILASDTATTTASVTPKALTYTTTAASRVYDGTTAAAVTLSNLIGLVGDETLMATATGAFSSKDAGTGNTVTVTRATLVNGSNGGLTGNYSIAAGGTASANITARELTYTTTARDKVYDGTTAATVSLNNLAGLVGNETLVATGTGSFNSKDVAAADTVTVTVATLADGGSGGLASNYSIAAGGTASAHITPASLTITADDQTKLTGTPNPELTMNYLGFVAGESAASLTTQPIASTAAVTASPPGSYAITVSGAASSNYAFTYVPGTLIVTSTSVPGYLETLGYLDDVADEAVPEDEEENVHRGDFSLLQIKGDGIRLPAGVQ